MNSRQSQCAYVILGALFLLLVELMSVIANYKNEDDFYNFQMNQCLECNVLHFCTESCNLLTRCTHVQILWCFRFWHLVVLQEFICILENLTLWSGDNIFIQNGGTHLLDYMSEPGYHSMNVHCFESLVPHTFTHTLFFVFIVAAVYVTFILSNIDFIIRDILKFSKLTVKCG